MLHSYGTQNIFFSGVGFSVADEENWDEAAFQVIRGGGCGVDGTTTPNIIKIDTRHHVIKSLEINQRELFVPPTISLEIAHLLKWLQEKFACPVDVEFMVNRNGAGQHQLSIVQVRPITHLKRESC